MKVVNTRRELFRYFSIVNSDEEERPNSRNGCSDLVVYIF